MIDLDDFYNLSLLKKSILTLLISLFVFALIFFFALKPKLNELCRLQSNAKTLSENKKALVIAINLLKKQYASEKITLFAEPSDISKTIMNLLNESNLSLDQFYFLANQHDTVSFQIQIKGTFDQIISFLNFMNRDAHAFLPTQYIINKKSKTATFTFDTKISRQHIKQANKSTQINPEPLKLIGKLSDQHRQWILIQLPNGEIEKIQKEI